MQIMNKKERVKAAIAGQQVDCVPAGFSIHFPREVAFGDAAVKAHLDFYRETGVDMLKVMNENLIPLIGEMNSAKDWLKLPSYDRHAQFMRGELDLIRRLRDAEPDAYLLATVHGICASTIHPLEANYGYEPVRELMVSQLRDPASRQYIIDAERRIFDALCDLVQAAVEEGCDGIYYAALGAERHYYTDEEFAEAIRPFDLEIMKAAREAGGDVFLHMCKHNLNMERYQGYADYCDVANWGVYEAPMSLEDGRKLFPHQAIMGGLANHGGALTEGSEDDIRAEVRRIINDFGREGFILGADCTLPTGIDMWRLRAAVDAAHEA